MSTCGFMSDRKKNPKVMLLLPLGNKVVKLLIIF